ncbi:MAG: phosphoadenylyl-sulfate reductase [Gammaproteobacteria bacterium]|nr:phosphoadenylyl-sulfate reductase [Gammaproteobacteria bacterium]
MQANSRLVSLVEACEQRSPQHILKTAFEQFPNELWLSFSGADDIVLVDMAWKINPQVKVFTIDTGRLHSQTYQFLEQVRNHYSLQLEVLCPDGDELKRFTSQKGLFSFYQDGHSECCSIRKIAPLRKKLAQADAWITGQRKDQSPSTRNFLPEVEVDNNFSTQEKTLYKFNPLANMTSEDVWNYIRALELPYNPLHSKGYSSIGCEPCTRPILPNQHEREGRWWWEQAEQKECGLHAADIIARD